MSLVDENDDLDRLFDDAWDDPDDERVRLHRDETPTWKARAGLFRGTAQVRNWIAAGKDFRFLIWPLRDCYRMRMDRLHPKVQGHQSLRSLRFQRMAWRRALWVRLNGQFKSDIGGDGCNGHTRAPTARHPWRPHRRRSNAI
jgi:hypothetical protein